MSIEITDLTIVNCGRGIVAQGGMRDFHIDGLKVIDTPTAIEVRDGPVVDSTFKGVVHHPKPGRNEPCWCGSGKKYKKCCLP